jgi:tRNA A37 threonylcarbamoyladenosine dehydratase
MLNEFSRMEILLGTPAMKTLADSRVAIFGIGGVGGYAAEAIARGGVGASTYLTTTGCLTNINRQLIRRSNHRRKKSR